MLGGVSVESEGRGGREWLILGEEGLVGAWWGGSGHCGLRFGFCAWMCAELFIW